MTEHTPGPWYLDEDGLRFEVMGADRNPLAMVRGANRTETEQAANAQLISAAPDLLALAHKALLRLNMYEEEIVEELRAVIVKAGAGHLVGLDDEGNEV